MAACNKDDDDVFRLDPNATISLKPDLSAWTLKSSDLKSDSEYLTPLEIVQQTSVMRFKNDRNFGDNDLTRGFSETQRSLNSDPPMLLMWGTDIIDSEGNYVREFIEGNDCILEVWETNSAYSDKDTIAYIPNSVLRAAEAAIIEAYNNNDYETVYQLFNEAFTFRPTTGAEYRALKEQGLN